MSIARKSKNFKAALPFVDFHPRMLFSMEKFLIWLANIGVKPPAFKISRLKLQKLLSLFRPSGTGS